MKKKVLPWPTFDPDVSTVRLYDTARDEETEPGAFATLDPAGPMTVENVRELVLRDARAGVGDRNTDVAILLFGGESDLATFAAELDGIPTKLAITCSMRSISQ